MNLLTDIVRDVAISMSLNLTEKEIRSEAESTLQSMTARLGWMKHKQIMKEGMPWLEREEANV